MIYVQYINNFLILVGFTIMVKCLNLNKMKLLLPWEDMSAQLGYPYFIRRIITEWNIKKILSDWRNHPRVWLDAYGIWWRGAPIMVKHSSKEEAMAAMDKSLIDNR